MLGTVEDAIADPFITAKPSDTSKPFASAPLVAFMKSMTACHYVLPRHLQLYQKLYNQVYLQAI